MDVGLHHRAESLVDHPVPLDRVDAVEAGRADMHGEVTESGSGAFVADMPVTVVANLYVIGRQRLGQRVVNPCYAIFAQFKCSWRIVSMMIETVAIRSSVPCVRFLAPTAHSILRLPC